MIARPEVQSTVHFLQRDPLYEKEKPYENRRPDWAHIPQTNAILEKKCITIQNVRGKELSFGEQGFICMKLDTDLAPGDFRNEDKVLNEYLPKLTDAVKKQLGADRIQIYDFTLRKRHPSYPAGTIDGYRQPANSAHIDETYEDARRVMLKLNPTEFESLSELRWQSVIAWKPLNGPVRDWPLALCDKRTINPNTDLQLCDILDPNQIAEEYILHHSLQQKWYYLEEQLTNEVWLMLQTDSDRTIGVPHAAFEHPDSGASDVMRQSVDVTMLVFYSD